MVGLHRPQLLHELVVLGVGDLGRVEDVIAVIVEIDLFDELFVVLRAFGPIHLVGRNAAYRHACSLIGRPAMTARLRTARLPLALGRWHPWLRAELASLARGRV